LTFEVEIGGQMRHISVTGVGAVGPDGGRFHVVMDGAPHDVDVRRTDLGLSLLFLDTARSVDVATTERAGGEWLIQLPHVTIPVSVDPRRFRRGGGEKRAATGEVRVVAPMPGRVVRVLVKSGDEVTDRQGLVVVEAMKMENELGAPRAGRVREITVTEGTSVEAGRVLAVIE
jgi:biotin carboxyl carrier protein